MIRHLTALKILALALPVMFLAGLTLLHTYQRATAPIYNVAVEGYDPRDLVYGEYIALTLAWDDPRSDKPDMDADDLPAAARLYLPEGEGYDLEIMLREDSERFMAAVNVIGNTARIRHLTIDGRPWQEGLAAWRQTRDNTAYD